MTPDVRGPCCWDIFWNFRKGSSFCFLFVYYCFKFCIFICKQGGGTWSPASAAQEGAVLGLPKFCT